jgi:hypothetical protein
MKSAAAMEIITIRIAPIAASLLSSFHDALAKLKV